MCNIRGSGWVRRPYGQDALVAGPVHEYKDDLEYYGQGMVPSEPGHGRVPFNPTPSFYEDYGDSNSE